jgi:hypothetical protein
LRQPSRGAGSSVSVASIVGTGLDIILAVRGTQT